MGFLTPRRGRDRSVPSRLACGVRAIAAAHLVAWMAFVPVAQVWHLSFGARGHRYCPTHERIEEVAPFRHLPSDGFHAVPAFRDPAVGGHHVPCSLLNWDMSHKQRALLQRAPSSVPALLSATVPVSPAPPPRASGTLLLTAPKNSPPQSLA
jgi:hypothetical protein